MADVDGQKVTWLTPHVLQQVMPQDVDYKSMLTFLEFYETLPGFVNLRLYNSINLKYPPILDPRIESFSSRRFKETLFKETKRSQIKRRKKENQVIIVLSKLQVFLQTFVFFCVLEFC